MGELRPHIPDILATGVKLVFIGNGSPDRARAFAEDQGLTPLGVPVLTDPLLDAYRAAGLARGLLATMGPRALFEFGRALARGYRQTGVEGDSLQQGGALLVAPGDRVVLHRPNLSAGGHARPEVLLEAARRASAAA